MKKLYIAILTFFLLISCGADSPEPVLLDCRNEDPYQCDSDKFMQFNYCIDLSIINSDDRLRNVEKFEIWAETYPSRAGVSYESNPVIENQNIYEGSFCVPIEDFQDSIVMGILLGSEAGSADPVTVVSFFKVPTALNSIAYIERTIEENDIWGKEDCDYSVSYNFIPTDLSNVSASVCLIGSLGDCNFYARNLENGSIDDFFEEIKSDSEDAYSTIWYSTPCFGLYFEFY